MYLLGYDLRFRPEIYLDKQWNNGRRRSQLVKDDIRWPKSVYTTVWPSWFDQFRNDCRGLWEFGSIEFDIPAFVCRTLDSVFLILRQLPASTVRDLLLIAIFRDDCKESATDDTRSNREEMLWTVEGYDVADEFMVSAISGSGIGQLIDKGLVEIIAVNQHCLIDSATRACAFARRCDDVLPDHRPFYVYRIEQYVSALV